MQIPHARTLFGWLLSLGLVAVVLGATSQDEEHEHSELEEHMEVLEGSLKSLRRSMRDETQVAQSLEHLAQMQASTVAAKSLMPEMAASVPEGERATFQREYRKMMLEFLQHELDLERALLTGDAEAAKAAFKLVREMEDQGHERFTEDED